MKAETSTNRSDDASLVRAARAGDRLALAELLARHRPLVLTLCERALGDPDLAEDAAQEAAILAMLDLDRLRRPERFGPWLAGIGLNVCRRWRRARARDAWSLDAVVGGRFAPEPADRAAGPDEVVELAEERAVVRRAVAGLPAGQRAAVVLFYLRGLPIAETAAVLGIAPNAAKARLHKARANLRRCLSHLEEVEMDGTISRRTLTKTAGALAGVAAIGQTIGSAGATRTDSADERFVPVRVAAVQRTRREADGPALHAVVLAEIDGDRQLPIWMGQFEAEAIALRLEGIETPRPLTYAFAAGVLEAAGGRLREVRIDRLAEETFYAVAVVEAAGAARVVDARPSDALNLALLTGAPIAVAADVLEAAQDSNADELRSALGDGADGTAAVAATAHAEWRRHALRGSEES